MAFLVMLGKAPWQRSIDAKLVKGLPAWSAFQAFQLKQRNKVMVKLAQGKALKAGDEMLTAAISDDIQSNMEIDIAANRSELSAQLLW